jgi:hypothetical protein
MAVGPGKYDELCTLVREQAKARAAIVIIIGGDKGSGFSVQAEDTQASAVLPDLLENMAKQIREALQGDTT